MPLADVLPWVTTQVAESIIHNWPFLLVGMVSAAALKVYVGTDRLASLFRRRTCSPSPAPSAPGRHPVLLLRDDGRRAVDAGALGPWAADRRLHGRLAAHLPERSSSCSAGLSAGRSRVLFFAAGDRAGVGWPAPSRSRPRKRGCSTNQARFAGATGARGRRRTSRGGRRAAPPSARRHRHGRRAAAAALRAVGSGPGDGASSAGSW